MMKTQPARQPFSYLDKYCDLSKIRKIISRLRQTLREWDSLSDQEKYRRWNELQIDEFYHSIIGD